ncbi:unnamed protein product, partial [Ectocarpus sp. 12 AP-2014]
LISATPRDRARQPPCRMHTFGREQGHHRQRLRRPPAPDDLDRNPFDLLAGRHRHNRRCVYPLQISPPPTPARPQYRPHVHSYVRSQQHPSPRSGRRVEAQPIARLWLAPFGLRATGTLALMP